VFDVGTVLMSRGPFSSHAPDLRETELARIALADERPILGAQLRDLLLQKFTNPIQGIFGAHLMLLSRERASVPRREPQTTRQMIAAPEQPFDAQLFDLVVTNLRNLVGTGHPDIEALSLECANPSLRTTAVFKVPPMLRRSWSLIVAASNEDPHILDELLWNRVMARTMTAPFLSWLVVSDSDRVQLQNSIREVIENRRLTRGSSRQSRDPVVEPTRGISRGASRAMEPASSGPSPSEHFRRGLSLDLDIPRSAVERIIGES
jgi:hypothetical protein